VEVTFKCGRLFATIELAFLIDVWFEIQGVWRMELDNMINIQ